jgi:hypothetical protein
MRDGECCTTWVPISVGLAFCVGLILAAPVSMLLYAQYSRQIGGIVEHHPAMLASFSLLNAPVVADTLLLLRATLSLREG